VNRPISDNVEVSLRAPRYGLLFGTTTCHYCRAEMRTAAVWVASFAEIEEGEVVGEGQGALLHYVEHLDATAAAFVLQHAPWLRLASTRTSGQTYYAHHCTTCGALQGASPAESGWMRRIADVCRRE
jgi:hypothetical protein